MSEQFQYDDEAAIRFIQNHLPQELKSHFPENEIYYLLDVICDFYEKRDWLLDDSEEQEEQELIAYMIQQANKDDIGNFTNEEIRLFLAAEAAYSETLDFPE